jgi:hypothetical protein
MKIGRPVIGVLVAAIAGTAGSQNRGVRYGPGVCGPIDPVYVKTSTETGGQPFPLSTAEVAQSSRVMEASFMPQMLLWASGDSELSYSIPVDASIARMMVSGTFDGTGGSLTLIGPDGAAIRQGDRVVDTILNCGRIVTVDAPATGTWQVRVAPTGRFWLSMHSKSELSLTRAEFVEKEAGSELLVRIQGEPIADRPATLRVSVSRATKSPTFQLVSLDARLLQTLDLQSSGETEFSGTVTLPAEPFRVLVSAIDESGARAQRIWPGLFHGEVIEVVPPPGETVKAGTRVPVTFRIVNHGPPVRLNLVASDHGGKVIPVEPATLDLGATAEGTAMVVLTVPADAEPASEVSIHLTATADATASIGGFNGARKAFAVSRE